MATKYNGLGCTAWAMKNKNMDINLISEITGLTIKEINKL